MPLKLTAPKEFITLLEQIDEGTDANATLFTKSPRKNGLRDNPTDVKVIFGMERVETFSENKHELKMDATVEYIWPDERFESNKSFRLNYEKIKKVSDFWIPDFKFVNTTVMVNDPAKMVEMVKKSHLVHVL